MKNNIQDLSLEEMKKTNGGGPYWQAFLAVGLYLASEFDSIKAGAEDSWAGKPYNYQK